MLGVAAGFVYSADTPLAAEHAEIDVVLVDAVAKAGGAHGERHRSRPLRSECHRGDFAASQIFDRDIAVRVFGLEEFRGFDRNVFYVAIGARLAGDRPPTCCTLGPPRSRLSVTIAAVVVAVFAGLTFCFGRGGRLNYLGANNPLQSNREVAGGVRRELAGGGLTAWRLPAVSSAQVVRSARGVGHKVLAKVRP
jgi:hypothetical protein